MHHPFCHTPRFALTLCAMVLLLAGCATPPAPYTPPPLPQLLSATKVAGKGVPHGRSDSPDRFAPLQQVATDPSYGLSPANPVRVGGADVRMGSRNSQLFLNALRGPAGEPLSYERLGACCSFAAANSAFGMGMIDVYRVETDAQKEPVILYLNMYEAGSATAPKGFTIRQAP